MSDIKRSLTRKNKNETWDFSENHLKNYHGFDWGPCDGGNVDISTAYLARWAGPVDELDDPYRDWDDRPSPGGPCQKYFEKYNCCLDLNSTGSNLYLDDCISYTNETACEDAWCYWNTQGLPAPGVCTVDICFADNDFSGRITGGDLSVFKKELGRMGCPCNP